MVTSAGRRNLTVTGITGFSGSDSPPGAQIATFDEPTVLIVPLATAQQVTGLAGRITQIDVLARPGVSAAALRSLIARLLPPGAEALTGEQAALQQAAATVGYLGNLQQDLLAFSAAALVVAGFVIASTFSILTAQRNREYALLRVIGASRGQVLRSCLAEAGILGLTAAAAGTGARRPGRGGIQIQLVRGRLGSRCPHRGQPGHGHWYMSRRCRPGPTERGGSSAGGRGCDGAEPVLTLRP